jgi:ABC-2 type transport system ATP-binding protein
MPLADSISIKKIPAANSRDGQIIIDTSGDLVRFLPWIQSLQLQSLRIEPLGLRSVYDAVHAGNEVEL